MDAQAAIEIAKRELSVLFSTEGISDLGLEEIERRREGGWFVTLSFLRQSRHENRPLGGLAVHLPADWRRERRVVEMTETGNVLAVTAHKRISA
jgi:hypothetical protein